MHQRETKGSCRMTLPRMPHTRLIAVLLLASLFGALSAGCSADAKQQLIGHWVAGATSGKAGTLSDLTLASDGTFLYEGKNALGGTVRFAGTYALGNASEGPWIELVYHDFPDKPITWFYKVDGTKLSVSTQAGNLKNGSAMEFTKQK
jgi:hypothetical protein